MKCLKSVLLAAGVASTLSVAPMAWSQCHASEDKSATHAARTGGEARATSSQNLVDVAKKAGSFGTLLAAAQAAGFADDLAGSGPYTVLAPTDAAFAKLGESTIKELLKPENRDKLRTILRYHVIAGSVGAVDAVRAGKAETREGREVVFTIRDGKLFANDSTVVATDIKAQNGVIHVIDTVLMPPSEDAGKM